MDTRGTDLALALDGDIWRISSEDWFEELLLAKREGNAWP